MLSFNELLNEDKNTHMKSFRQFIKEGGKAVSGVSRINQENVDATVKDIFNKVISTLKLGEKDIGLLGSTGKKKPGESSGDIDVAIDVNSVLRANKLKKGSEVFDFIEKKVRRVSKAVKASKGFGVISLEWPIVNKDKKQKGQRVQLDLMLVDNLELAKFSFWSPSSEESKWKGIYRNMMLSAIATHMDFEVVEKGFDEEGKEIPVTFKRNFIDLKKGLVRGLQTRIGKSGKLFTKGRKQTLDTTVIADSPKEIVNALLGPAFNINDANSFESLFKVLSHPKFLYKKNKKDIINTMIITLKKVDGLIVPEELEKFV